MRAREYAQALYEAGQGKDEEGIERLAARLSELLRARGHERMLPAILRELSRIERKRRSTSELVVRVARRDDADRLAASIEDDARVLGVSQLPRRTDVDERLVGGYEVRGEGKRIDRTHKRALVSLYHTLISNT